MPKYNCPIFNVNAILKQKTLNKNGTYYAFQDDANGYSKLTITNLDSVDALIQGNTQVEEFAIFDNVSKIVNCFHVSYPNLAKFYIYNETSVVEISENAFADYPVGQLTIYVAENLLGNYQEAYPNLTFAVYNIVETFIIPTSRQGVMANPILQSDYLDQVISDLPSGQQAIINKVVVPSYFTNANVLWDYNFTTFVALNNNVIYYNLNFYSFLTVVGSGTITSEIITSALSIIPNARRSLLTNLVFNEFSDIGVALEYDYSAFTNLAYIWVDDTRYAKNDLIVGYTKVEYIHIEANGPYIEINKHPSFVSGSIIPKSNTQNSSSIWGTGRSGGNYAVLTKNSETTWIYYRNTGNIWMTVAIDEKFTISKTETPISTDNFRIFAVPQSAICKYTRLCDLQLYDSNSVIDAQLTPVIKEGEYGLLDLISNIFYRNAGTGTILGGDIYYPNTAYYYPLNDFLLNLGTHTEPEIAFFDFDGTNQPDMTEFGDFDYAWYDNANRTGTGLISLVNVGRYYLQLRPKNNTLTILGSGTLTKVDVDKWIKQIKDSDLVNVNTLVAPNTFTGIQLKALDPIDNYAGLSNLTFEYGIPYYYEGSSGTSIYTNSTSSNSKITNLTLTYTGSIRNVGNDVKLTTLNAKNNSIMQSYKSFVFTGNKVYLPEITTIDTSGGFYGSYNYVYFPKLATVLNNSYVIYYIGRVQHLFFGQNNISMGRFCENNHKETISKMYFPANGLVYYITNQNWIDYAGEVKIGVLDGNNIYNNIDGTSTTFNYPKLSATLTLNTTNGHLIENGTDLFDGYTVVWYSDEDCTTVISDLTTITSSTTAYVKLTII